MVSGQGHRSCNVLVASHLKFVPFGKVTFGADMGKQVRGVTEGRLLRTNAAMEQVLIHDGNCEVQMQVR